MDINDLMDHPVRYRGEKGLVVKVNRPVLPAGPATAVIQFPGKLFDGPRSRQVAVPEDEWDEIEILDE